MLPYSVEEVKEKVYLARDNKTAFILKNIFPEVPSWEQFILHIDFQSRLSSDFKGDDYYRAFGRVLQRDNFYLQVPSAYSLDKNMINFFKETAEVVNFFNLVFEEECTNANSFIHFSGAEPNVGSHIDEWDNVAWQCIGKTFWEIRKNKDDLNPDLTFEAGPGDVVVIPSDTPHAVIKDTPRAGITFGYNVSETRQYVDRVLN